MRFLTASALLLLGSQVHARVVDTPPPWVKEHYGENKKYSILFGSAPLGRTIDRTGWKVTCDAQQPGFECGKAIDGNANTFWHTPYDGAGSAIPHKITVDMGSVHVINGIAANPRQDKNDHGYIGRHEIAVSTDGNNWETVAFGTFPIDMTEKYANFQPKSARYFRITALSEAYGRPWTSIAEVNAYAANDGLVNYDGTGKWGVTINFPTVPVAGVVDPLSGKVTIWSAYEYDQYLGSTFDRVFTSVWTPGTNEVIARMVDNTDHDMFCPGISIDGTGKMIVTGGNSAEKTTLYDFPSQAWIKGPNMNIARGYQSSATLSDGRVFTIGGSWSGGRKKKPGEVYDPKTKTWKNLPGCPVDPLLTNDKEGIYRADNHAWLFGWKNGSVFQAGPSTAMNWYYTSGNGAVKGAGQRKSNRGLDPDSMAGISVMYDAVAGKILTAGGATSYQDADSHATAHIITIGDTGAQPDVKFASNGMWFPRVFHNAVVLPDGKTFIAGGQSYAQPFSDNLPELVPEMYDPAKDSFQKMQRNTIIRVYHSISLLLPDATVLNGGGGLCGDCTTNHFDAQIYTPQYLLNSDGSPATRPAIKSATTSKGAQGPRIQITTDSAVTSASLIRYGTTTHTVNTDQRRIPLKLNSAGANQYTADVPGDPGILLPGYYMLFVLNAKGVPSVAKTLNFLV